MNYEFLNKQGMFLRAFDSISESDYYKKVTPELGYQHKIGHIQKVMLFSQIIAIQENLNEMQMRILLAAAAFHDSGREKDRDDGEHGKLSAEVAGEYFTKNKINPFGIAPEDIGIVQTAIAYHVVDEEERGKIDEGKLKMLCFEYDIKDFKNIEKIKQICAILKDADALDRARFSSEASAKNSLNPQLLRTNTAKNDKIMEFAIRINQEYAKYVLGENYPEVPIVQNDAAKTLQFMRYDYKMKNNGKRKIEKEIPMTIVKALFRYIIENKDMEKNNDLERIEELEL